MVIGDFLFDGGIANRHERDYDIVVSTFGI